MSRPVTFASRKDKAPRFATPIDNNARTSKPNQNQDRSHGPSPGQIIGDSKTAQPRGKTLNTAGRRMIQILRHNARKLGLDISSDGYVQLTELLAEKSMQRSVFLSLSRALPSLNVYVYYITFVYIYY